MSHLAGRIAAKFALVHSLSSRGYPREARDLGITQRMAGPEEGRPVVQLPAGLPACDLSITHSHELAVAVVTERGRVGADLERVSPRSAALIDEVFTEAEQEWLSQCELLRGRTPDERWNLGWCIKEALVKCTGHGLRASLQQVTFSGWTEQGAASVSIPLLTDEPGALAQLITLHSEGVGSGPLTGLLALGQGYAFAALHHPSEGRSLEFVA
ncbi:4'-phosphopantetheinyl transferase superfamily protein [Stigmatella sp. ncwal1]|uniref:4'-phosphopantetheinyl transferase superfamily protein n=1 Tax=Stigmatella ashevillensis TaxID=2995309 RepID=A0ABT5DIE6_9BACT|nr:4'-phosphopantetheinyl transferase superfamily protein [Stigmatella ashevillena]MDC0713344.1 4'-phosphopantetheinyl transferase superfamily protein [Stigmatella ashevillena]